MTVADDLIQHFGTIVVAVLTGSVPFIGICLVMWQNIRSRQDKLEDRQLRQEQINRILRRINARLLDELRGLVPDWEPGPELAADFAELDRLEAAEAKATG